MYDSKDKVQHQHKDDSIFSNKHVSQASIKSMLSI